MSVSSDVKLVSVKHLEDTEKPKLSQVDPVLLQWKGVSYSVPNKKILSDLTGEVKPGEVCAVMGPSGSGKTTLMDYIANRIEHRSDRTLEGKVLINGEPVTSSSFAKVGAYVAQEESLVGTLTARETLRFAARLTLGGDKSKAIDKTVRDLIVHLGLANCADTIVGTVFQKGLSGGQKRRLSLAVELVRRPSLLVLDEPTSGLDASSAYSEVQHLNNLAAAGHTIILSIHQPSSEIWELFDKVAFMSGGEAVYFGKAGQDCLDYFETVGHPCPSFSNPADHVITLINRDFPGKKAADVDDLIAKFKSFQKRNSSSSDAKETDTKSRGSLVATAKKYEAIPRPMFFTRLWALTHRNFLEILRDPGIFGVRLFMYTMLAVVIGLMWLNLGDKKDFESIGSRVSLLFYVAAFMVFMSVAVLPFFIWQRDIFIRERANHAYDVPEYVLAKFIVSIPGVFMLALFTSILVVFMANLNGFGIYLLDLFISLMVAEGFMCVMAVIVPHYIIGIALAAGVFGFFMLCQGFFVVQSDIPPW